MTLLWCLLGLSALVQGAPHKVEKKSGHYTPVHAVAGQEDPVAALAALKPHKAAAVAQDHPAQADRVRQLSRSSSSSKIIKEVNGERKEVEQQEEKVSRNGELVSALLHQGEREQSQGGIPHHKDITELQVPGLNLHQRVFNNDGQIQAINSPPVKRNISPVVGHAHMEKNPQPQSTLEELAEYILETGDQASVVEFLELLLEEGKISQEEALEYIDTIKGLLEDAESRREEDVDDIEKIREMVRQSKEEEEEVRKLKAIKEVLADVGSSEDTGESETFLRINDYLEKGFKGGKLSRNTYNLLKEALIQSVLDKLQKEESPLDYSANY